MSLTETNFREKEFHNKLQSKGKERFENIFYKALYNMYEDFILYISKKAKNKIVLDYGCGTGSVTQKIAVLNPFRLSGIDISEVSINKAIESAKSSKLQINYSVDNCEETKFKAETFDLIFGKLTPKSRSVDEHPFLKKDFDFIHSLFNQVTVKYYGFFTLIFFLLYGNPKKSLMFKVISKLDNYFFRIKYFKSLAWSVMIVAKKN